MTAISEQRECTQILLYGDYILFADMDGYYLCKTKQRKDGHRFRTLIGFEYALSDALQLLRAETVRQALIQNHANEVLTVSDVMRIAEEAIKPLERLCKVLDY